MKNRSRLPGYLACFVLGVIACALFQWSTGLLDLRGQDRRPMDAADPRTEEDLVRSFVDGAKREVINDALSPDGKWRLVCVHVAFPTHGVRDYDVLWIGPADTPPELTPLLRAYHGVRMPLGSLCNADPVWADGGRVSLASLLRSEYVIRLNGGEILLRPR